MLFTKRDNFTSFFPIWMSRVSFSYLMALARTSSILLTGSIEIGRPCLIPGLRGKAPSPDDVSCEYPFMVFIMLWCFSSIPTSWEFLFMKGCWISADPFFLLLRRLCDFLSFILLVLCATLLDFCMLSHLCIPGVASTWSWCWILRMCCWILILLVFCWVFLHVFIRSIGL